MQFACFLFRIECLKTGFAHSYGLVYFHPGNFLLVLAARGAENTSAVPAVVLALHEGELDLAVEAGFCSLVFDPMVHHPFARGTPRHCPREDPSFLVTDINCFVVLADGQRRHGRRAGIVGSLEGRVHRQFGSEHQLPDPGVPVAPFSS